MDWAYSTHRRPVERPNRGWVDRSAIKMGIREIECDNVDQITLAQGRHQWQANGKRVKLAISFLKKGYYPCSQFSSVVYELARRFSCNLKIYHLNPLSIFLISFSEHVFSFYLRLNLCALEDCGVTCMIHFTCHGRFLRRFSQHSHGRPLVFGYGFSLKQGL